MQRVDVPGTTCLDGSTALYFYSAPATPSKTWVIYLEGGANCFTQASCAARAKTPLGSSKYWNQTFEPEAFATDGEYAILSGNATVNPDFAHAHRVFVPYCSADDHLGTRTNGSATWGFVFSGHLNFRAIVQHLNRTTPLASPPPLASQPPPPPSSSSPSSVPGDARVLLTGASAGGLGALGNVDWLRSALPAAHVSGAPIAGWFFPGFAPGASQPWAPPSDWAHWRAGVDGGPFRNASGVELFQAYLHPACAAAQPPGAAWRCSSAHVAYPYVASPLFVLQNVFDAFQNVYEFGLPVPYPTGGGGGGGGGAVVANVTAAERGYLSYFGAAMRASLAQVAAKPADGLFAAACFEHVGGLGVGGGTSLPLGGANGSANGNGSGAARRLLSSRALAAWFFGGDTSKRVETTALPLNPSCTHIAPSVASGDVAAVPVAAVVYS